MNSFSIIIPCYNCEAFIQRCLTSIEKQNYSNVEIILINDCSKDKSVEVIEKYISNSKMNIKFIKNRENLGAGATRNVGIKYAENEYLLFLDSDDCLSTNYFNEINSILNRRKYDCIIYDAAFILNKENKTKLKMFYSPKISEGELDPKEVLALIKGCSCGKIYKTKLIKENNIQFAELKRNEDLVFTKTAVVFMNSFYYLEKELYLYINNEDSLMNNDNLIDANNAIKAFDVIFKKLEGKDFFNELNCIYFIEVLYSTTITYSKLGYSSKDIVKEFFKHKINHSLKNKYIDKLNFKYRFIVNLVNYRMIFIILLITKMKKFISKIRNK